MDITLNELSIKCKQTQRQCCRMKSYVLLRYLYRYDTLSHWGFKKRNRNLFRKTCEKFEAVYSEYIKYSSEENVQSYFKTDENYSLIYQKRAKEDCFLTEVLMGKAPFFICYRDHAGIDGKRRDILK